jgi:NitT/TauT family transport system permease protein
MKQSRHVSHSHHHGVISYPVSIEQRLYTIVLGPLCVVGILYLLIHFYAVIGPPVNDTTTLSVILFATLHTVIRLIIAYVLAVVVAIPLAILVTSNSTVESIMLPVFDILESVPILALFPVIILFFIQFNFLNGAAIFILFLAMLWNLVFTIVGGLKIIPKDIDYAAHVFGVRGFDFFRRVTLPAIVPQLVTGSILAVAQGWNLIIVAEVLHTYIPGGSQEQDLFGVGSILVSAAAHAQNAIFIVSVLVMVVVIGLLNFFVWQKLLHFAQRFRFE